MSNTTAPGSSTTCRGCSTATDARIDGARANQTSPMRPLGHIHGPAPACAVTAWCRSSTVPPAEPRADYPGPALAAALATALQQGSSAGAGQFQEWCSPSQLGADGRRACCRGVLLHTAAAAAAAAAAALSPAHEVAHHVPALDLARGSLWQLVGDEDALGHLAVQSRSSLGCSYYLPVMPSSNSCLASTTSK